jgi:hypothetical protein
MNKIEPIFWEDIDKLFESEIDYYRNLYENPKNISKEKSFEYVCKIQALKKMKQRIAGNTEP